MEEQQAVDQLNQITGCTVVEPALVQAELDCPVIEVGEVKLISSEKMAEQATGVRYNAVGNPVLEGKQPKHDTGRRLTDRERSKMMARVACGMETNSEIAEELEVNEST